VSIASTAQPREVTSQVVAELTSSNQQQLSWDLPPAGTTTTFRYKDANGVFQSVAVSTDALRGKSYVNLGSVPAGRYYYEIAQTGAVTATITGRVDIPASIAATTTTQTVAYPVLSITGASSGYLGWPAGVSGATTTLRYRTPGTTQWSTYSGPFYYDSTGTVKEVFAPDLPGGYREFEVLSTSATGDPLGHATGLWNYDPTSGLSIGLGLVGPVYDAQGNIKSYGIVGPTINTRSAQVTTPATIFAPKLVTTTVTAALGANGVEQLSWDAPPVGTQSALQYKDANGQWQNLSITTDAATQRQSVVLNALLPGTYQYQLLQTGTSPATVTGQVVVMPPGPLDGDVQVPVDVIAVSITQVNGEDRLSWPPAPDGFVDELRYRTPLDTQHDWQTVNPHNLFGVNGMTTTRINTLKGREFELVRCPIGSSTPSAHATGLIADVSGTAVLQSGSVGLDASGHAAIAGSVTTSATYHFQAATHTETVQLNVPVIPVSQVTINNKVYMQWPQPNDGSTTVLRLRHPLQEDQYKPGKQGARNATKSVWQTVKERDFIYLNGMKMIRIDHRLADMEFDLQQVPAGGGYAVAQSMGMVKKDGRNLTLQIGQLSRDENGRPVVADGVPTTRVETITVRDSGKAPREWSSAVSVQRDAASGVVSLSWDTPVQGLRSEFSYKDAYGVWQRLDATRDDTTGKETVVVPSSLNAGVYNYTLVFVSGATVSSQVAGHMQIPATVAATTSTQQLPISVIPVTTADDSMSWAAAVHGNLSTFRYRVPGTGDAGWHVVSPIPSSGSTKIITADYLSNTTTGLGLPKGLYEFEVLQGPAGGAPVSHATGLMNLRGSSTLIVTVGQVGPGGRDGWQIVGTTVTTQTATVTNAAYTPAPTLSTFTHFATETELVAAYTPTPEATVRTTSSMQADVWIDDLIHVGDPQQTTVDPLQLNVTYYKTAALDGTPIIPTLQGLTTIRSFTYNSNGDVTNATDGAGQTTIFGYDATGNQASVTDALGNIITRTFTGANVLLTETINGKTRHNVYDQTYPTRLLFEISAEGRVTAYGYDAHGQRTSKRVYTTAQYTGSDFTPGALGAWAAQYKNAVTLTDYVYDIRGELSSQTVYAKLDATTGLGIVDGTENKTFYVYDPQGRLIDTHDSAGGRHYVYDGLDRLVTDYTDLELNTYLYDEDGNRITTTLTNGLTSTAIYDHAGRLAAQVQRDEDGTFFGSTLFTYDADDRQVMSTDAAGVRTFTLYDTQGRKAADVDGVGALTEYVYDSAGRLARTIQYATPVSPSLLADANGRPLLPTLDSIRPTTNASANRSNWRAYDVDGRLAKTVDADGGVTQYFYDAASHLLSTVQYATAIDVSALASTPTPDAIVVASSAQDRVLRNFYDGDGLLRGTLDAEGYLHEMRYDAAGRLVQKIAYATATDATLRATGALAALIPSADAANDQSTIYLYDGRGMQVGEIDAEGYLTEYTRDARGRATRTVRYAHVAKVPYGPGSTLDAVRPIVAPNSDHTTTCSYDSAGRATQETDAEGTITQYFYDATTGALLKTLTACNTADAHVSQGARYDRLGRMVGEVTPEGYAKLTGDADADAAIWRDYGLTHTYDAANRRTSTTDQYGNKTLFYYDADGHLTFTVNALGEVTENRYDALGNLTDVLQHATRISTAGLAGGTATTPFLNLVTASVDPTRDGVVHYGYKASGRLASRTDALTKTTGLTYNAFGEVQTRTDPFSTGSATASTSYTYDRRGLQTSETVDPSGINALTKRDYDAFGRVKTTTDANNKQWVNTYDRLGRLTRTRDALLVTRSTDYDAFGRVTGQTDAFNHTASTLYDDVNRSVQVTTPEGVTLKTFHDRDGHTISVTDGRGTTTNYLYTQNGQLRSQDGPQTRVLTYNRAGQLIEEVDGTSDVTITYDAAGRVLTRTQDPNALKLVTTYTYDAQGREINIKDPKGIDTKIEYDLDGRVWKRTVDPTTPTYTGLNLTTTYTYDGVGRVVTETSPGGSVTRYGYDKAGRRTSAQVDGLTSATKHTWEYDGNGNVTGVIDGNGNRTRYVYDANNQLVYTVDAEGGLQKNDYDAEGRVTRTTRYATKIAVSSLSNAPALADIVAPAATASDAVDNRVYDKDGRVSYTIDGLGSVVHFTYDGNGNVKERYAYATKLANWQPNTAVNPTADAAHDQWVRTQYDAANRSVYTIDAMGSVTTMQYDANGHLMMRRGYANAVSNPSSFDGVTQLLPAESSTDSVETYAYDAAGRLKDSIDAVGHVTRRIYDADGNLTQQIEYANGTTPSARDRVTNFGYDKAGRVTWRVDAQGYATTYAYDANGNVTDTTRYAKKGAAPVLGSPAASLAPATDPKDRHTRSAYDAANRLQYSVDPYGVVTEYVYDGLDHVTKTILHATPVDITQPTINVTTSSDDRITQQSFDKTGRLWTTTDTLANVTSYDYDGAGRLLTTTEGARVTRHWYDTTGRVTQTQDAAGNSEYFEYDTAGNKTKYTNALGKVWTYGYDVAGRMIAETSPVVSVTSGDTSQDFHLRTTYEYDAQGRLLSRTEGARVTIAANGDETVDATGTHRTTYDYDGLGRQIRTHFPAVSVYTSEDATQIVANGLSGSGTRTDGAAQSLYTETRYDEFGNAVAGRNLAGDWSYKTYDLTGRLVDDVDEMGYVTAYGRNAFGDVETLTRYAANIDTTNRGSATLTPTDIQVSANASADRVLKTDYDLDGRAVQVTEPAGYTFDADTNTYTTASKVTKNTYNVFGDVINVQRQKNATDWLTETRYYDKAGRLTASVDALGYLTTQTYDRWGNLLQRIEYATQTNPDPANPITGASDRKTGWTYDALNRKTSETKYNMLYSDSTDTGFNRDLRGDLTTQFDYDAAGNLVRTTDAAGGITSSVYDALGRVTSVTGPSLNGGVASFTELKRDAWGNAVVQIAHSGVSGISDRTTRTSFDAMGRALQITDAMGGSHYSSYDEMGHLRKTWETVTSGSTTQTLFKQYAYDKLGRQTQVREPSSVNFQQTALDVVTTTTQYNAFGETTVRAVSGDASGVYWDYDIAGRLWRTNEDGVDKVYLYDRLGRRTAMLQSGGTGSGDRDVKAIASAQAASTDATLRRTDYQYDALGHVTETLPGRQESFSDVSVRSTAVSGAVVSQGEYVYANDVGQGPDQWRWTDATISLSWGGALALIGSGDLKIDVQYTQRQLNYPDNAAAYYSETAATTSTTWYRDSDSASTGTTLTLPGSITTATVGGVCNLTHVSVSKRDANGNWVTVIDQGMPQGTSANVVDVEKVSGLAAEDIQVLDKQTPGATWTTIPKTLWHDFGAKWEVDLRAFEPSRYQYRLVGSMANGVQTVLFTGNLSDTGTTYDGTGQTLRPTITKISDRWGNLTSVSDARNAAWVTQYEWDANNQMVREWLPMNGAEVETLTLATTLYYDKLGRRVGMKDADGNINRVRYDGAGNVIDEYHADGGHIASTYDGFGEKTRTIDAENNQDTYTYNKLGLLTDVTHWGKLVNGVASGFDVSTGMKSSGSGVFISSYHAPSLTEHTDWDSAGRKIATSDAAGHSTQYKYDLRGNIIQVTLPSGATSTQTAYDAHDRKVAQRDGNGKTATWSYDDFGRVKTHQDIGGATTTYTYDNARQLKTQVGSVRTGFTAGQNIAYTYDAAGELVQVNDITDGQTTSYIYDLAGNKLSEQVLHQGALVQDNHLAYDALGRLRWASDGRARATFDYDLVGNRTHISTHVTNPDDLTSNSNDMERYYAYDAMNRQKVIDGVWDSVTGKAVAAQSQGHELAYDHNGNRTTDKYWGKVANHSSTTSYSTGMDWLTESYTYDGLDRLASISRSDQVWNGSAWVSPVIDRRAYDWSGHVVQSGGDGTIPVAYLSAAYGNDANGQPVEGNGSVRRFNAYDADGRLVRQQVMGPTTYTVDNNVFDGAGNLTSYTVTQGSTVNTYTTTLAQFEGYKESKVEGASTVLRPGTTNSHYDANGFLVSVDEPTMTADNRTFINDLNGQVIAVREGDQLEHLEREFIVNGEVLARYGSGADPTTPRDNFGRPNFNDNIHDFQFGYRSITPTYPSASPGQYTVQNGDTLRSIASSAYGDADLWYEVAQANGIASDADLRVGMSVTVPNVVTSANNANTFVPYDPSKIVGDTTPYLKAPPPKFNDFVDFLAQVIGMVVSALLWWLGPLGAAIGNLATQAVEIIGGNQKGFDGKSLGMSLVSSGVSEGMSSALSEGAGQAASEATTEVGGEGAGAAGAAAQNEPSAGQWLASKELGPTMARAAIANAITQGIGVATGLQKHFSWTSVAASAIGAGVGEEVGQAMELNDPTFNSRSFGDQFGPRFVTGLAAGVATAVARGGRIAVQQIAVDAFGQAAGGALRDASVPTTGDFARADRNVYSRGLEMSGVGNALGSSLAEQASSGSSTQVMGAGPSSDGSVLSGQGLRLTAAQAASWGPTFNVPASSLGGSDLYSLGKGRLSNYVDEPVAVSMPVEDRSTYIVTRPLPPLPPIPRVMRELSAGQYVVGSVNEWADGLSNRLDLMGEDPSISEGLRFGVAMARGPGKWIPDGVKFVAAVGGYALDSDLRSQVNTTVGNFFSNDPIGTTKYATTRYWNDRSLLEIGSDAFNTFAGGSILAPLGTATGLALKTTGSVIGEAGEAALRWSQKLSDYSLEFPPMKPALYNIAGAIDPSAIIPTIRNLRAEAMALAPEGFEVVRISKGAAIMRYADDTYYSVPKGQYSLIPELRTMDTMGDAFTRRAQAIADRFEPGLHLTDDQVFRLNVTQAMPDKGWLYDKFFSAYKGSYVHAALRDELPLIPGAEGLTYKSVGPDIISNSGGVGLKYEITQLTPSLNAIFSHTRKYPSELMRYVTYR
jgi:YD repeat-containing protein